MGALVDRTHKELSDEDIARIAGTYHAWRGEPGSESEPGTSGYADVPGFCKSATTELVATHGCVLTPGRFVGAAEAEADGGARQPVRGVGEAGGGDPGQPGPLGL